MKKFSTAMTMSMFMVTLTVVLTSGLYSQAVMAKVSINDMQTCQGLIDFLQIQVEDSNGKYNAEDIKIVQKGLSSYNDYIQESIVSPGLLAFYKNDQAKADDAQKQVDAYKLSIVQQYQQRNPNNRIDMNLLTALNNCTLQAVPAGQQLEELKLSFEKLVGLTNIKK